MGLYSYFIFLVFVFKQLLQASRAILWFLRDLRYQIIYVEKVKKNKKFDFFERFLTFKKI